MAAGATLSGLLRGMAEPQAAALRDRLVKRGRELFGPGAAKRARTAAAPAPTAATPAVAAEGGAAGGAQGATQQHMLLLEKHGVVQVGWTESCRGKGWRLGPGGKRSPLPASLNALFTFGTKVAHLLALPLPHPPTPRSLRILVPRACRAWLPSCSPRPTTARTGCPRYCWPWPALPAHPQGQGPAWRLRSALLPPR